MEDSSGGNKKKAELLSEEQQAVLKQKGAEIEQLQTGINVIRLIEKKREY